MNAIIQPGLFDYNALDTEARVKLQQLERELKDDHHTVDRLVAETLDKMWSIGSKYHEVQLLLRSRATNNFKTWFTATHAADNGGLLRKAYRCINIYQNVSRDKLSLLADTGKSTVYTLAAKETPDAARAEIFKRLGAGEKLEANDIVEIIESAKAAEMPMMLPMVVDEPATTGIETFQHLTPGNVADDHIVETNEMVTPAVTETHEVGASYHEAMKPVGTPKFTPGQLNTTHVIGDKPPKWVNRYCSHCNHQQDIENNPVESLRTPRCEKCGRSERNVDWLTEPKPTPAPKAESPTIAPPPPPPPPPPPATAKPVGELAKVEYDAEAEDDEDDGPVELTPIAPPPPPPASAIPLPPPPPLVARSQIDIALEFERLPEAKRVETAWLILSKLTKQQVSDLFIKFQLEGRK